MLNDLRIDDLLQKVDSRYGLVVSSAKRARQINEYTSTLGLNDALGIPGPQVHTRSQHPLTIAIEELRQDKLEVTFKQPPEAVEEQIGAAAGDHFVSPPGGAGSPGATSVDSGAAADDDEEEGAGAA
ncbi:MAG: DNA-directed RNA polymerase omega subunit [uncultured Rubrobacteraceae bacterium]|uniref:DNA-directed RNA polymerase subunit omega n=1 Tax=uncultured Rubrobacteraceae bacterium TaxID=349277 RepID=A0A6J4R1U1_9ACTN|nr:MAG: DNA-directed RNA polymerase omega subunit [uncultured Rubrobacteraceae bacterium]